MSHLFKSNRLVAVPMFALATIRTVGADEVPPAAFTTNCVACHLLDQNLVGPSLVEIAELYPDKNRDDFIKWTIEPGRKRDQLPQMPSMAHIPEEELIEIYHYIRKVTVGVRRVKLPKDDPFAIYTVNGKRPRVERTFVPHAGPASVIVSLPTEQKHNLVWDTDQCRLRYISEGETDRWPYLRSNGNALAQVGVVSYQEKTPLFKSDDVEYKGYHISEHGYPTFVYRVDDSTITEEVSLEDDKIVRTVKGTPDLPEHRIPKSQGERLEVSASISEKTLTLVHSSLR